MLDAGGYDELVNVLVVRSFVPRSHSEELPPTSLNGRDEDRELASVVLDPGSSEFHVELVVPIDVLDW